MSDNVLITQILSVFQ